MARKQYPLRIDPAIWESVQAWADDEMRSANGQIEWIVRDALRRAGRLPIRRGGDGADAGDRAPRDAESAARSEHAPPESPS
ncbi:hypothetical protein Corgl_1581 [Coriobacterium glomerans PW2]|uniref:Arc-like DNA binding domain-containing protein n=1 Tax=Coriobacterium glomerans (strain ATCC 49209 / DSM 20642 / JCM 10262 / PW2) TaxID=700015 RepID=F2NB02_CORGP|nr:hypothetical protein [Coriobacterium glomerans]AEB07680.1 hypothetical protein Corgl_1581 [Coriobacterium glomerans PW2]